MDKEVLIQDIELLRRVISQDVEFDSGDLARCPFHEDKTPSLHLFISKSGRARYHCFGCGAAGDVFNYVMNKRKVKFILAQLWLSKFIGENITSVSGLTTSPSSLPKPQSGQNFCFNSCQNYANVKEDYEALLLENRRLREELEMPEFRPSNESE